MLTAFKNFVSQQDLFDPGDRILLAVSGGLDSMVMTAVFQEAGYSIAVAHCNFQLRGEESDGDEAFIKQYCARFKIDFYSRRFSTKNYAEETRLSVQMAARELRYNWFDELMEEKKFHWLATAHHLDDNIETVLLRWIKGANLDQLTGIPVRNGKIIRPLLFATRQEILDFAKAEKLMWREDASNATSDYQRNFVRHQVVPRLKELNPSLAQTFGNSLEKIKGAHELMKRGLGQLKDTITKNEGQQFMVDKTLLLLLEHPVFVCYEWLRPFGFEWDRCDQLISALDGAPGKKFLSNTHEAVIDREYIIVSPRQEWAHEILIEDGQAKAVLGPWVLTLKTAPGNKIEASEDHGTFDAELVKYPLVWRKWRNGDSFCPLGLAHRKKLSDFLIDEKVPLNKKQTVTVIESGGEIVWVVGLRIDDRFKVTSQTTAVVHMHQASILK